MEHVEKVSKKKPRKLQDHAPLEDSLVYLWSMYLEVNGPDPLTFRELQAWSDLTKNSLEGWEVKALMELDRIKQECLATKDTTNDT